MAVATELQEEHETRLFRVSMTLLNARPQLNRVSDLFQLYIDLLHGEGVPIHRAALHLRTLHPQAVARSFYWTDSEGLKETVQSHETVHWTEFLDSPMPLILGQQVSLRRRLQGPRAQLDFNLLSELAAEGFADYLAAPMPVAKGPHNVTTIATKSAGGFGAADLRLINDLLPVLSAAVEPALNRDLAKTLLAVYIGERTVERVWDGTTQRGQGEELHAVVLNCDLRGFTWIAANQPLTATIETLNDYFDAVCRPIREAGGEILKFIGDAVLAIFPCARDRENCTQAAVAIAAARRALANLETVNAAGAEAGKPALQASIGISVGDMVYGNIGFDDRLDFTVIGSAVNLASRLVHLSGELGEAILFCDAMRSRLPPGSRPLGDFALKGMPEPQAVYAPAPVAAAPSGD